MSRLPHRPPVLGRLLQLRPEQLEPARYQITPGEPSVQTRLNEVVRSFAVGYNHAIAPWSGSDPSSLSEELRGFAVEGAAMSSALADLLTFSGGRRLGILGTERGTQYIHMIHVGAGWAFARLHRRPWHGIRFGEPVVRWLAWDGWGFHQSFFNPGRVFSQHWIERAARGEARAVRDQGAGRALWFCASAEPASIAAIIGRFPEHRRCDLWAGIGLAASYTGAQSTGAVADLLRAGHDYQAHLAQGAAFAAKARMLSGVLPATTAAAIEVLTGATPATAAEWTDASLAKATAGGGDDLQTYERWRALVRECARATQPR